MALHRMAATEGLNPIPGFLQHLCRGCKHHAEETRCAKALSGKNSYRLFLQKLSSKAHIVGVDIQHPRPQAHHQIHRAFRLGSDLQARDGFAASHAAAGACLQSCEDVLVPAAAIGHRRQNLWHGSLKGCRRSEGNLAEFQQGLRDSGVRKGTICIVHRDPTDAPAWCEPSL
eukprot:Skav223396  [mRNA]  locus=scaffold2634:552883:557814:+ [translate_table: standard]